MTEPLYAPECECGSRTTRSRIAMESDLLIVRCDDCGAELIGAEIVEADIDVVLDPAAGSYGGESA